MLAVPEVASVLTLVHLHPQFWFTITFAHITVSSFKIQPNIEIAVLISSTPLAQMYHFTRTGVASTAGRLRALSPALPDLFVHPPPSANG